MLGPGRMLPPRDEDGGQVQPRGRLELRGDGLVARGGQQHAVPRVDRAVHLDHIRNGLARGKDVVHAVVPLRGSRRRCRWCGTARGSRRARTRRIWPVPSARPGGCCRGGCRQTRPPARSAAWSRRFRPSRSPSAKRRTAPTAAAAARFFGFSSIVVLPDVFLWGGFCLL